MPENTSQTVAAAPNQTSIGRRKLIGSKRLLVADPTEVWVTFSYGSDLVRLRIRLLEDTADPRTRWVVTGKGDHGDLQLLNFKNSLGTMTTTPISIGKSGEGHELSLEFAHWKIGTGDILDLQLSVADQ